VAGEVKSYPFTVKGTRKFGVACVVDSTLKRNILDFKAGDERVCILRIKTKFHNRSSIDLHAPTEEKFEMEEETCHQKMKEAYDICLSNDIIVLVGDLNASIRREEDR
jgi:hypothetical protein